MNKAVELINWLDTQCPHGTMTDDLSYDFAKNLRERLIEIKETLPSIPETEVEKIKSEYDHWMDHEGCYAGNDEIFAFFMDRIKRVSV